MFARAATTVGMVAVTCGSAAYISRIRQHPHAFAAFTSPTNSVRSFSAASSSKARYVVNQPLTNADDFDVVIVGGGIVGLAVAREINSRFPKKSIAVLEKEPEVAKHQSGHNSGVIHAGMYYVPGSTMAKCCVEGVKKMYKYCKEKNIPHQRCGKLICAATEEEYPKLELLLERGNANGVEGLKIITGEEVLKLEPKVEVFAALYSPNTGIVDYAAVSRHLAEDVVQSGKGDIKFNFAVEEINLDSEAKKVTIVGREPGQPGPFKQVRGKHVITCAGLYADRVAQLGGGAAEPKVVPFRGTYYQMKPEYRDIVKMNIYPVPSGGGIPVGVHFTPTCDERRGHQVIVGPGACIAFSREGYRFFDMRLKDLWAEARNIGLWRFAMRNWDLAFGEIYRDLNKEAFLKQAQKLIPSVTADMTEKSFTGVMSQVFKPDGYAADDYIVERKCLDGTTMHVRNAPSPACTSSLAIADHVVNLATEDFGWTK